MEVADTGMGIPKIHQAFIWEEFHQGGNHERDRGQGLGPGLAIVRSLGRVLDHEKSMESALGTGSMSASGCRSATWTRLMPPIRMRCRLPESNDAIILEHGWPVCSPEYPGVGFSDREVAAAKGPKLTVRHLGAIAAGQGRCSAAMDRYDSEDADGAAKT
jgi:hypothetical protein